MTPSPPTCSRWSASTYPQYQVTLQKLTFSLQEWNEDLAYQAQYWASACEYAENEDRNTQSTSFDYIGESFAATVSYTVNYTQLIGQLWYGERKFFNYYAAACLDENGDLDEDGEFETCGSYTQVHDHSCIRL